MSHLNEEQLRALVRRTLRRQLGLPEDGAPSTNVSPPPRPPSPSSRQSRPVIDEALIADLPEGSTFPVPSGSLVTPLARDAARVRRIRLEEGGSSPATGPVGPRGGGSKGAVAIGADHGGVELKEALVPFLQEEGFEVIDVGPFDKSSVDYPDYAYAVARLVSEGQAEAGIMIDGVGIGSCMAANKVPGVRASMCYDVSTARNAREHNHANYLTLGGQLIGPLLARQIVSAWLSTPFGPGRHANRVGKIMEIEQRYLKQNKVN